MFEQTNKQTLNFMMAAIAANLGVWAQQCERGGQSGDGNSHTRTHTHTLLLLLLISKIRICRVQVYGSNLILLCPGAIFAFIYFFFLLVGFLAAPPSAPASCCGFFSFFLSTHSHTRTRVWKLSAVYKLLRRFQVRRWQRRWQSGNCD